YSMPRPSRPRWTASTRVVPMPHIGSATRSPGLVWRLIAVAAVAGSTFAGWAVDSGRYRPRRWARASRWAVGHTDRRSSGASAGRGRGEDSGRAVVMSGFLHRAL